MASLEVESNAGGPSPLSDEGTDVAVPLTDEQKAKLSALPLDTILNYLRKNCKTEWGATEAKRVEYFRGLAAVKCLMRSGKWEIKKKAEAVYVLERLLQMHDYFHQAVKVKTPSGSKRLNPVNPAQQQFLPDQTPYIWTYEISSWMNTVLGVLVLVAVFAGTLFPLWPQSMRDGVWWISMAAVGLIGLFFVTCIVRLILFVICWVGTGGKMYFWLYPNLLRDDDDFWGSFVPWYSVSYKTETAGKAKDD